jgi:hypothetical protein
MVAMVELRELSLRLPIAPLSLVMPPMSGTLKTDERQGPTNRCRGPRQNRVARGQSGPQIEK